jgi:phosphate transport system substrate-binding protein
MSRAVCTNLPAACSKAASRALLPLKAPDDRCPECAAALLPIDAVVEASPSGAARWVVPVVGVALVAAAGFFLSGRGESSSESGVRAGAGAGLVTQAGAVLEGQPPAAGLPAALTLHGTALLGPELMVELVQAFLRADGLQDARQPDPRAPLLVARTPTGTRLEFRLEPALSISGAAGLRRVSVLGDDIGADDITLGRDALAVVVHPDSPLRSLTPGQLRQRLLGRVGRPDGVHLLADPALQVLVSRQLLGGEGLPTALPAHADSRALLQAVAADPSAIGLVPLAEIGSARVLPVADASGAAWMPDAQTLAAERYPLTHRVVMHLPTGSDARLQRLASYLAGPAVQQRLAARLAVPAAPQLLATGQPATAETLPAPRLPRDQAALIRQARLLGGHIGFEAGADTLDAVARAETERLGRLLASGQVPSGAAVVVLASANDPGGFCGNRTLSERRAAEVARVLGEIGVKVDVVRGIGRLGPAGLDATPVATMERRAEIWVSEVPLRQPPPFRCSPGPGRASETAPGEASAPAASSAS